MTADRPIVVHQGKLDYVRQLRRVLEQSDVPCWIVPQPGGG